jgi:hypothetical protein
VVVDGQIFSPDGRSELFARLQAIKSVCRSRVDPDARDQDGCVANGVSNSKLQTKGTVRYVPLCAQRVQFGEAQG